MEAAGVELSCRIENKQVIEELGTPQTLDAHKWAFHCTRIAHGRRDSRCAPHFLSEAHEVASRYKVTMTLGMPIEGLRCHAVTMTPVHGLLLAR